MHDNLSDSLNYRDRHIGDPFSLDIILFRIQREGVDRTTTLVEVVLY